MEQPSPSSLKYKELFELIHLFEVRLILHPAHNSSPQRVLGMKLDWGLVAEIVGLWSSLSECHVSFCTNIKHSPVWTGIRTFCLLPAVPDCHLWTLVYVWRGGIWEPGVLHGFSDESCWVSALTGRYSHLVLIRCGIQDHISPLAASFEKTKIK